MYIQQTEFTEQLKKLKIDYIRYRIINVNSTSYINTCSTCNNTSSKKKFKVTKDHLCKKESILSIILAYYMSDLCPIRRPYLQNKINVSLIKKYY